MSEPVANYRIVGTGGVEHGTDGVGYTAIGVIVSASRKDTGDKIELKDRQGNVFVVIYFNDKNECSIEVIFDEDVTIPVRGDAIDICGLVSVLVDDVDHKWGQKERMFTIAATKYAHLVIPG